MTFQDLVSFEGVEKVLEIIFSTDDTLISDRMSALTMNKKMASKGLFRIDKDQWQVALDKVKCQILDQIENDYSIAYLLSESSLFVYQDRIIIKTCGTTRLLLALVDIIEMASEIGLERIESLFYSRKGYMFPDNQEYPHGNWDEEVDYIRSTLMSHGKYHIKNLQEKRDDWAIIIATPALRSTISEETNMTLEIQMSDLDLQTTRKFYKDQGDMFNSSGISRLYPTAKVNDYTFDPCGYSLNALFEKYYYTIHVTPEAHCSYASFESTIPIKDIDPTQKYSFKDLIMENLKIFKPGNFTVSLVSRKRITQQLEVKGFCLKDYIFSSSHHDLEPADDAMGDNGWCVCYYSFEREQVDR